MDDQCFLLLEKRLKHISFVIHSMDDELQILLQLNNITNNILQFMKQTHNDVIEVKTKIDNLNNDYFEKHCEEIVRDWFSEHSEFLSEERTLNTIEELVNRKNMIEKSIRSLCVHEWVRDYIDVSPEKSERVCYCIKCETTQR